MGCLRSCVNGDIAGRRTTKLRCDKNEVPHVSGDSRGWRCFLRGLQEPNCCGYSSIIEASGDGFPDFVESGGGKDDDAGPDPLNAKPSSPGICRKASTSANPGMSFFDARICGLELPSTIEDTNPCRLSAPHDLRRSCARLCHSAGVPGAYLSADHRTLFHRRRIGKLAVGPIFQSGNGSPLNLDNLARRVIIEFCEQSKSEHQTDHHQSVRENAFPRWHGWHAFRRGIATNLHQLGVPDRDIQAILRHSNIGITMNIYVKSGAESQVDAMDLLGEEFEKQKIIGTLPQQKLQVN
jgi:hypothetical protein